jgi:hypothetical protein
MAEAKEKVAAISNNNNSEKIEVVTYDEETKEKKIVHRLKANTCTVHSVTVFNDRAEITRSVVAQFKGIILFDCWLGTYFWYLFNRGWNT